VVIRLPCHRNKRNVVPFKRQHEIETGLLIHGPDFAVIAGMWGNSLSCFMWKPEY